MRLGFFLGFLIGAAIASVIARAERAETPPASEASQGPAPETASTKGAIEQLRQRAQEAMAAAKEAADQTEADMQRQYDQATRQQE